MLWAKVLNKHAHVPAELSLILNLRVVTYMSPPPSVPRESCCIEYIIMEWRPDPAVGLYKFYRKGSVLKLFEVKYMPGRASSADCFSE